MLRFQYSRKVKRLKSIEPGSFLRLRRLKSRGEFIESRGNEVLDFDVERESLAQMNPEPM